MNKSINHISINKGQFREPIRRDHEKGHNWDHNKPGNQDYFINSQIREGIALEDIIRSFKNAFPNNPDHRKRVLRHIKHLIREHDNFPYCVKDGNIENIA